MLCLAITPLLLAAPQAELPPHALSSAELDATPFALSNARDLVLGH